jgi:PIN domain nuclease of toxin-antitoxin system
MLTICDTHMLLFWSDSPERLSEKAKIALESGELACCDISLWEIAMLYTRGRINKQAGVSVANYIKGILLALNVTVLPITAKLQSCHRMICIVMATRQTVLLLLPL